LFSFNLQKRIEKAIMNVMLKTKIKATTKMMSAIFSYKALKFAFVARRDKKANRAQAINKIHARPVASSINETWLNFVILREVKTIRQNPSKLDDEFRM
jgi:hypothetical protein